MHVAISAKDSGKRQQDDAGDPTVPLNGRDSSISAYDYLLLLVGTTSGAIMLLLIASLFSPARVLALGLLLGLAVAYFLREQEDGRSFFKFPDPWLIGCVLLALFFRENFATNYVGGQDPGAYVNFSGIMGHFGGLYFPDTFRSTLPDALKQLYDRAPMAEAAQIWPLGDGLRFQAAWYPLHPAWMAMFSGLFGDDYHGLSMLLFSLLGVTGGYFLTLELAGHTNRSAARLAALLMAVNPALCFMAKFPLTEAQTAALLLNAGYLLAKGLKARGRGQLFLLVASFVLLIAYFFTRLSFPILAVPWAALFLLSCSRHLDEKSARRLGAYLWLLIPAGVMAGIFYYAKLPMLFNEELFITYWPVVRAHPAVASAAAVVLVGFNAFALKPVRDRLQPYLEFGMSAVRRAAPWLPLIIVLASVPSALHIVKTGHLFYDIDVTPELAGLRYHIIYRWMLAITPLLWCLMLALPALKWPPALTIPLLFVCATLALTEVHAPSLPYLYYHMRYLCSEIVPFCLVIASVVLITMWQSPGWRRYLAVSTALLAVTFMGAFSALQLRGQEGQDPRFFHQLDDAVASDDVLLLSQRDDPDIGVPIRYFFNKQLFIIPTDATKEQIRQIFDYFLDSSGTKYGRILLLAPGRSMPLPVRREVERWLIYTDSIISNSEHWRSGGFESRKPGRMILPYAWHTATAAYTLYRVKSVTRPYVAFGCPIDFSQNGNSEFFVEKGWSHQEATFRWTEGPTAALRIRFERPTDAAAPHQLFLDFQAVPFGASQRVTITVDGQQAAVLQLVTERRDYEVEVSLDKSNVSLDHEIVFSLPDAHSPASVGLSDDTRQLGIAMTSLTVFDGAKTLGRCD